MDTMTLAMSFIRGIRFMARKEWFCHTCRVALETSHVLKHIKRRHEVEHEDAMWLDRPDPLDDEEAKK